MSAFNEDSRVKFPTIMHLVAMGYDYVSVNHGNIVGKGVSTPPPL
jgi:hypothetical protein